jgi:hypothetical protein
MNRKGVASRVGAVAVALQRGTELHEVGGDDVWQRLEQEQLQATEPKQSRGPLRWYIRT